MNEQKKYLDLSEECRVWAQRVDLVLNQQYPTGELVPVCLTPLLIQQTGFDPLVIAMKQTHIKTALAPEDETTKYVNMHGLDRGYFNKLPEYISKPAMIFNSINRPNSIVVITEKTDERGRPIVAALIADKQGMIDKKDIVCNLLASTYGRENFEEFLTRSLDKGALIFYDEKKSADLLNTIRLQLPQALTSQRSNVIIRRYNEFVNSLSEKSSEPNEPKKETNRDRYKRAQQELRTGKRKSSSKSSGKPPSGSGSGSGK